MFYFLSGFYFEHFDFLLTAVNGLGSEFVLPAYLLVDEDLEDGSIEGDGLRFDGNRDL